MTASTAPAAIVFTDGGDVPDAPNAAPNPYIEPVATLAATMTEGKSTGTLTFPSKGEKAQAKAIRLLQAAGKAEGVTVRISKTEEVIKFWVVSRITRKPADAPDSAPEA